MGSAPYTTAFPTASGTGLTKTTSSGRSHFHSHIPLRHCCPHRPPQMVAVGCEVGSQHTRWGNVLLATWPGCYETLRSPAAPGSHSLQLWAMALGAPRQLPPSPQRRCTDTHQRREQAPDACRHSQQLTSLRCQDTHPERGRSARDPTLPVLVRRGWQGGGAHPALPPNPLPSSPTDRELQERRPARFVADGSQHVLRLSAQRAPVSHVPGKLPP